MGWRYICGESVHEVMGDKSQKIEWSGYGLYLEVPNEALPPGVTAMQCGSQGYSVWSFPASRGQAADQCLLLDISQ